MINKTLATKNIWNKPLQMMQTGDLKIYYGNSEATYDIYNEVFLKKIYDFESTRENPVIIDAGSNIGISTLFFKQKYPLSKVLCFEPDPNAFLILEKNISSNHLKDVTAINAALSKNTGIVPFYGEFSGMEADSRGNSIIKAWGQQRKTSAKILVNTQQLSNYIHEEVDFLKIDIEGAEQQVLEEMGEKLHLIKEIIIEIHEIDSISPINNLTKIKSILSAYNFIITTKTCYINDQLPHLIQPWVKKVHPIFKLLKASKA